uniref:DDE Tnp4 domain-containing protein n=1 Tax=Nothobranchius furzeri TaxID=105023 RepID=A0A8C6NIL0_NOTFU
MKDIEKMEDVLRQNTTELADLHSKKLDTNFCQDSFEKNEDKTKFYKGLPNFLVLLQIFELCEPYITYGPMSVLSKFEQFMLVLIRLRLNLPLKDLAFRFKISLSSASRIWHKLIDILYERLEFQIEWPERHVLHATMPMSFREAFGNKVAVIVDCFEVFIERPSNLLAQAQTWSNYTHHHTVKFLIGVAPQGYVTYISCAWGGRVSNKQVTLESGLLKNLLPGDIILADRGFSIGDSVGFYCASLQTPAFTKGKKQLSACEVAETRKIASLRIHVERIIGLVRRKYQILQSRAMPIEHMATKPGEALALIDKIVVICCVLSNFSESIQQGIQVLNFGCISSLPNKEAVVY